MRVRLQVMIIILLNNDGGRIEIQETLGTKESFILKEIWVSLPAVGKESLERSRSNS